MRRMENLTRVNDRPCIRFRPKTDQDDIFITIQNGSGCSAYVGYFYFILQIRFKSSRPFQVGYLQGITLNRTVSLYHSSRGTCMRTGIIQHELLHVLGSASVLTILFKLICFSLLLKASFMNSLVPTETSTCLFDGKIFKMVAEEVCVSNTNLIFFCF